MAAINYSTTLDKMDSWLTTNRVELIQKMKLYEKLCEAIATGEGDPNGIALNAGQIAKLKVDKSDLEGWIEATCSAWDVEPIEIEE